MTMASGLPYVILGNSNLAKPFGVMATAGLGLGALVAVVLGRRRRLTGEDLGVLLACAAGATMVCGHVFDVAWYPTKSGTALERLTRVDDGLSLVGAIAGVAIVTFIVATMRRLDLRQTADVVAVGALVAVTLGRIGCALAHDHPGVPTDSFVGLDMPAYLAQPGQPRPPGVDVLRVHDVGFDELLVLLVLLPVALVLLRRWRQHPGRTTVAIACVYAVARFGLDFLRLPATEPTRLGLTGGQWGMVVMFAVAMIGLRRLIKAPRPASA